MFSNTQLDELLEYWFLLKHNEVIKPEKEKFKTNGSDCAEYSWLPT